MCVPERDNIHVEQFNCDNKPDIENQNTAELRQQSSESKKKKRKRKNTDKKNERVVVDDGVDIMSFVGPHQSPPHHRLTLCEPPCLGYECS